MNKYTKKIRKAIFPVAGMGTRFLPATKANPKEMLPIVDKPLIQYAVEEAVAAGVTEMIFVTSSSKRAIEDHFDTNFELETKLAAQGKQDLLAIVKDILPDYVTCIYVRQHEAKGLGHAVLCAKDIVGNEPFAVLLADDLIDGGNNPCLRQLVNVYEKTHASIVSVQRIAAEDSEKYGVVDLAGELNPYAKINGIVEKPTAKQAPSKFGVVGRYILNPQIFQLLENTAPGSGGEIQLTDAIAKLLDIEEVYALKFAGTRYDCGTKIGYLEATIKYALKHATVAQDLRAFLQALEL
jgi:UTP--glucose-1-phosphate uridylyltransferase